MVNLSGGGSTRFSDHFKPVEITEYSQTWVKASKGAFASKMERVSDNMAFFPTRQEATKWYKKKILESLAADKTSIEVAKVRMEKNKLFLELLERHA